MRRPLRSKRARISPVRARSKASGLTRISVCDMPGSGIVLGAALGAAAGAGGLLALAARRGRRRLGGARGRPRGPWLGCLRGAVLGGGSAARGTLPRRRRVLARPRRRRAPVLGLRLAPRAAGQGRLAVRAERPARVDGLAAALAGVLEAALAVGAPQVGLLYGEVAVGAGQLGQLAHAQLGGLDLDLALARVLEVLRRAQDRVDRRANEGEERCRRGAEDEDRVADPPAGVEVGVGDQREPENDEHQDEEVRGQIEAVVFDAEDRELHEGAPPEGGAVYFVAGRAKPAGAGLSLKGTSFRTGSRSRRRRGSRSPRPRRRAPSSKAARSVPRDPCGNRRTLSSTLRGQPQAGSGSPRRGRR